MAPILVGLTDQDRVTLMVLLLEFLAAAVNCCVFPDATIVELGVTVMLAIESSIPVALKVADCPGKTEVVAVTTFVPAAGPRVRVVEALPSELVNADVADSDPPPEVTEKDTLTLLTGFPFVSLTIVMNGLAKGKLTRPL
jgi:hypothetical protein